MLKANRVAILIDQDATTFPSRLQLHREDATTIFASMTESVLNMHQAFLFLSLTGIVESISLERNWPFSKIGKKIFGKFFEIKFEIKSIFTD